MLERRYCSNHPDRLAIGVCVETKKPICGECSTRYNGVNYSREGLELLRERRRRQAEETSGRGGWFALLGWGTVMSVVMFGAYWIVGMVLMGWLRGS